MHEEALESPYAGARQRPISPGLSGTTPPHIDQSTRHCPCAARRLVWSAATFVVAGTQFNGIYQHRVATRCRGTRAVRNLPQPVRPGSLMWTCESTRPGSNTASPKSCFTAFVGTSSGSATARIRSPSTNTAAGRTPSGVTTRRERKACDSNPRS